MSDTPAHTSITDEILHNTCKVKVATNGAKAREATDSVLLMGVAVSEIASYDRLKANPPTRDIPARPTETTGEPRRFDVRAVDYIQKPVSPTVVSARVQTHAALREAHEQLERRLAAHAALDTAPKIQLSILLSEVPRIEGPDIAGRFPGA